MPQFDLKDYIPVQERINDFRAKHPNGRIETNLMSDPGDFTICRYRAAVYRDMTDEHPAATGWAFEKAGEGMANRTSHEENCETSAIGRALANLGYATSHADRASREEMSKVARMEEPTPISEAQKQAIEVRHLYGEVLDAAGRVGVPIREGDKFADMARKIVEKKGPEPKYVSGDALASYREVLASLKQMADR